MSSYLAQGLAQGLQSGLSSYRQTKQEMAAAKEREEEKAWRNEQRDWQRSDRAQKDELRTSLASAAAPAQVDQGTRVTDAAGSDAFTKDADAAAMMGDMVAGQQPSLRSATRVQGRAYDDPEAAKKAEAEYNQPTSRLDRMGDAAMGVDPQTGMSLKNASMTQKKNQMELDDRQKKEADETYNAVLTKMVDSAPNWWDGAADALTTSAHLVLPQGSSIKPVLSADGKTVDMVAVSPEGQERVVKTLPSDKKGKEEFLQSSLKADSVQKLKWLSEQVTREYEQGKQQERHELTLAEIRARGDESRQTAGYRDGLRDSGGTRPLNSMDRMLIDGRRAESQRELRRLEETIEKDRGLNAAARLGEKHQDWPRLQAHNQRIEEARAEYQRWNDAMNELATGALDRRGLAAGAQGVQPGAQPTPAASSAPIRVNSKAERDKLPAGARYVGPDGQTYVKK